MTNAGTVVLAMTERDARFCVEHLRHLADREVPKDADHAAACLSARWLAGVIEAAQRPKENP
jgi:hypothetical protein